LAVHGTVCGLAGGGVELRGELRAFEHGLVLGWLVLAGLVGEERGVAGIGNWFTGGWNFEAACIEITFRDGLPAFVVIRWCRRRDPLTVIELISLDPVVN
jgi:uncharacterized membrane protein YhdT